MHSSKKIGDEIEELKSTGKGALILPLFLIIGLIQPFRSALVILHESVREFTRWVHDKLEDL